MAQLIKPDGTVSHVDPKGGKQFTLEELQGLVSGYIEPVRIVNGDQSLDMLVNEEGLIHQLPLNPKASILAGRQIVGNAIILRREEWE